MSRKSRLKKKNKQKLQKRFVESAPKFEAAIHEDELTVDDVDEKVEVSEKKAPSNESAPTHSGRDSDRSVGDSIIDAPTRKLISRDVKMIIFTLVGLAIVLVAVRILEIKTPYIDTFGSWLYKITNIQTM